jgi:hypothetical protein
MVTSARTLVRLDLPARAAAGASRPRPGPESAWRRHVRSS